jgi:hypothetical protein
MMNHHSGTPTLWDAAWELLDLFDLPVWLRVSLVVAVLAVLLVRKILRPEATR